MVSFKIRCGDDIRRISIDKETSFKDIVAQLKKLLNVSEDEDLILKYLDDEGDKITLSSDLEFKEALHCCKEPIQLYVVKCPQGFDLTQSTLDNLDVNTSRLLIPERLFVHQAQAVDLNAKKTLEREIAIKKEEEVNIRTMEAEERERARIEDARKRMEEERKKREEERMEKEKERLKKEEEERKRLEEERKRLEEERLKKEEDARNQREDEERKRKQKEVERLRLERIMEELKRIEASKKKAEEEEKKRQEELRQAEEDQKRKRMEEERKRIEDERKRMEEERKRMEEERKRIEEEKKREEEEDRKRIEAEKRALEQKIEEERKRIELEKEEQKKIQLQKAEEKRKAEEEKRRVEEETRKKEEERIRQRQKSANPSKNVDVVYAEYKARNGKYVLLDLSQQALDKFGVRCYQRVNTAVGAGTVIGVDQEHGFLWFQLDKDKDGISYWDDITDHDSLICKGIVVTEENATTKNFIPLPKSSEELLASVVNADEKQVLLKVIQESLLDQKQKEMQEYYRSLGKSL